MRTTSGTASQSLVGCIIVIALLPGIYGSKHSLSLGYALGLGLFISLAPRYNYKATQTRLLVSRPRPRAYRSPACTFIIAASESCSCSFYPPFSSSFLPPAIVLVNVIHHEVM